MLSGMALESPAGDLMGHELRRAALQASRLMSSDPRLGKEHLQLGAPAERQWCGRWMVTTITVVVSLDMASAMSATGLSETVSVASGL